MRSFALLMILVLAALLGFFGYDFNTDHQRTVIDQESWFLHWGDTLEVKSNMPHNLYVASDAPVTLTNLDESWPYSTYKGSEYMHGKGYQHRMVIELEEGSHRFEISAGGTKQVAFRLDILGYKDNEQGEYTITSSNEHTMRKLNHFWALWPVIIVIYLMTLAVSAFWSKRWFTSILLFTVPTIIIVVILGFFLRSDLVENYLDTEWTTLYSACLWWIILNFLAIWFCLTLKPTEWLTIEEMIIGWLSEPIEEKPKHENTQETNPNDDYPQIISS